MVKLHELYLKNELEVEYMVKDGLLYYQDRILVPNSSKIKEEIIKVYHDSPLSGHGGFLKMFKAATEVFFWIGMRKDIKNFVEQCAICQQIKYPTGRKQGTLHPLQAPTKPWQDVTMDFIIGLPNSHGHTKVLVVVDRFSKQAHFIALQPGYTASVVADKLVQSVIKLHGFPRTVVTDRDPLFLSRFWSQLMRYSGTELQYSTAYHPETDGQSEIVNRCLEQYLRCYVHCQPRLWYKFLPWAEFAYNSSYHNIIRMSPYEVVYGVKPSLLPGYHLGEASVESVDELMQQRTFIQQQLQINLQLAQQKMKKQANKKKEG